MKMMRAKTGSVLQGYFRAERFRGPANRGTAAQPKGAARPMPQPPRPDLLPAKLLGIVGQPKTEGASGGAWHGAPRPELLPGMGPTRVGGLRWVAQARPKNEISTTPIPAGQLRVIGQGRPLEPGIRQTMEAFFQADFSRVRVHEGPAAPAMGALAFTLGEELHFAPGLYDPKSREGVELLGHELTHVVQQRDGRVANPYGHGVAIVQDPTLEAEADWMGRRVADEIWSGQRTGQPVMASARPLRREMGPGASRTPTMQAQIKNGVLRKDGRLRPSGIGACQEGGRSNFQSSLIARPPHPVAGWRPAEGAIQPSSSGAPKIITKEGLEQDDYLFSEAATGGVSSSPPNTETKMEVRILRLQDVDYKVTASLINNVVLGRNGRFSRNVSSDSPFHQNKEQRLPQYNPINTGVQPYLEYLVPELGGARIIVDLASNKVYLSYHYGDASAKSRRFPYWVKKAKKKISPFVELDPGTWTLMPIIQDAMNWWSVSGLSHLGNPGT